METMRSSVLCRALAPLWFFLCSSYENSVLGRLIRGIARGLKNWCAGSAILGFLAREGALTRSWRESLLCRILMLLVNLPTRILQWIYGKLRGVFEGSVFADLALSVAEQVPYLVGWVMLAVMVIPYEKWSNGYSYAAFLFCAFLAVFAGMRREKWRLDVKSLGPWLVAFFGMVFVAWVLSAYRAKSVRYIPYYLTCMLCVLVLVSCVERKEQLQRLLGQCSLALLVLGVVGIVQRIMGVEVNASYVDVTLNAGMPGRVYGFYDNPNAFAQVLLLLLPLAVGYLLCTRSWMGRLVGLLAIGAGAASMAMTYSRATWLGLVLAAVVFVLLWNRKLIPAGIVVGLLGLALLPDTVFHRIMTIFNASDTSTTSRFPLYQAAGEFLKLHPLTGAGLGTDAVRAAVKDMNLFHGKDLFVHCHNIYLQIWCEMGIVGLIAFVGGILWSVKEGARAVLKGRCSQPVRLAVIGGVSALMGALLCGMADYLWNYPRVMLIFWFVCGILLAAVRLAGRETAQA